MPPPNQVTYGRKLPVEALKWRLRKVFNRSSKRRGKKWRIKKINLGDENSADGWKKEKKEKMPIRIRIHFPRKKIIKSRTDGKKVKLLDNLSDKTRTKVNDTLRLKKNCYFSLFFRDWFKWEADFWRLVRSACFCISGLYCKHGFGANYVYSYNFIEATTAGIIFDVNVKIAFWANNEA